MAAWATFTGFVGVILVLLLALARASAGLLSDAAPAEESTDSVDDLTDSADDSTGRPVDEPSSSGSETGRRDGTPVETQSTSEVELAGEPTARQQLQRGPELSTPALLANVVLSQGLLAVLLVVLAWYTEIPAWAFGLSADSVTVGTVGTGVAVGGVFYGLNEAAAAVGRRRGMATSTELREALAPETAAGWAVLLGVVLPIIAGFEELLFRGALIGVIHAGFGVSPWLLAVGSSVAFGLGHGAQGRLGIVVTSLLGIGLAAVFILTESLGVVIVAHYVINSLEFIIHEGVELA